MKKFTITQTQSGDNLFLYPNEDLVGCTDFIPFGASPNFACVDDTRLLPDDDTTYVTWSQITEGFDLYEVPDHDKESGAINYVQIFARAKSHNIAQEATGIYKIICSPDGLCTDVYASSDIDLITGYTTYSNVWTVNPKTTAAWTWDDIDLLCIGEKCDSPNITGAAHSTTFRPNAPGSLADCTPVGDAPNWKCVDEAVADEDTTYNKTTTALAERDSFNIPNHTTEVGTITGVTVYIRGKRVGGTGMLQSMIARIKTGGNYYSSGGVFMNLVYNNHAFTWDINPDTVAAWTWADIDALEIGYDILALDGEARLTQCYAIVNYTENINPEIRTTQIYAKVNYDADDKVCWLSNPKSISKNHARNVKKLNFWNGEREVYDLNRNGKSVVMEGTERFNDWCNEDYNYRKKIHINHEEIDDNLTNFPVLINITDSDISNHSESTNGYDIIFFDENCLPLFHELESYTTDGHLTVWVLVPHVDAGCDTTIEMYYGNSNITTDLSSCCTWADYAYVFHMNDHADTSHVSDSSCNEYIGTKTGANEPIEDSAGRILECQNFDGVNDDIDVPDPSCICPGGLCFPLCFPACWGACTIDPNKFTITVWASHTTDVTDGYGTLIDKAANAGTRHYTVRWLNDDDILFIVRDTANRSAAFERFSGTYDNQWVHILGYVDSVDVKIYINGELGDSVDTLVGNLQTNTDSLKIGRIGWNTGVSDYRFNGKLDEVRLRCEAVPNPAAWANAEYRNQNSLVSFLDIDVEEDITTPCLRIKCVKELGRDGNDVTTADLGFTTFNSTYQIRSFGWKEVSVQPSVFDWILELERST